MATGQRAYLGNGLNSSNGWHIRPLMILHLPQYSTIHPFLSGLADGMVPGSLYWVWKFRIDLVDSTLI